MWKPRTALFTAFGVGVLVAGGMGALAAKDDGEHAVGGATAQRARVAAVAHLRGGQAGAVERDGERGATYEVEVRRADGTVVDVRLDAAFRPIATEVDGAGDAG
jgi:hypothetical protein